MDCKVTEQVIDALGITSSESITAISRALSYLGITTSYLEACPANQPTITILIDSIDFQESCYAEFSIESKKWSLPPDINRNISIVPKGEQDLSRLSLLDGTHLRPPEAESELSHSDWTATLPRTEHVDFLKNREWATTGLGLMQQWPLILRYMTMKMLSDPRPACLYWGKDRIAIYNEPFVALAYSRHPAMMGATARDAMPATWPFLSQMFQRVEESGRAFSFPEFEMMVHKEHDILEEAWYDGIWSPITGLDGTVEGFYNSGYEITTAKMSDRRNRLCRQIAFPPDLQEKTPWQHMLDSCEPYDRDVTMLILYSVHITEGHQSSSYQLCLEGSLGVPQAHSAAPDTLDLYHGSHGFLPEFRASKANGASIVLDTSEGRFPDLLDGMSWRGFGEAAKLAVVTPLFVTGLIAGFAVIGLNPRRPYDEGHGQFVHDLGYVFATTLSECTSQKQAIAREAQLSKELTRREKFIRNLTHVATVGIYSTSITGAITYANAKFHEMTGMTEGDADAQNLSLTDFILPDDQQKATSAFQRCLSQETATSEDLRLNRKWKPPGSPEEKEYWILNSITANYEDGEVIGTLGCLTDISQEVWALELQKDLAKSAEEAKRQQERFIDVTSHEMRNPLSAVMQCADSIRVIVEQRKHKHPADDLEIMDALRESAQTILFCTAHQKRIIDDILTVSKLDSTLLAITPILTDPVDVARKALQMFEGELSACNIDTEFSCDNEYDVASTYCDPTRLTQILINLITNAIKFTSTSEKRFLQLVVGESKTSPPPNMAQMKWFPKRSRDLPEFASDDEVYLTFQLKDTGKGMSADEMALLFNRFSQASPMTHVQYGGSGLGLYISRELTEMQGGMIGVASTPGEGSTFGLYIKAQKATPSELEAYIQANGRRPSAISTKSEPVEVPQRHVLLVEDNLVNQKVLLRQLQRQDCIVHVANHGLEALDIIRQSRFWRANNGTGLDLTAVLMDWEMPICDGLTATRRLRELEQQGLITEHLLVIMATANARSGQVSMAMEAGADDLLAKPFTISQVIKKIDDTKLMA